MERYQEYLITPLSKITQNYCGAQMTLSVVQMTLHIPFKMVLDMAQ